ncbi:MAG: ABC transporter ATP-binding protein [Acidobacteriota bacterium]|nr:ABC transporter ATP-binding protein [Acidobacteriota bacterium]
MTEVLVAARDLGLSYGRRSVLGPLDLEIAAGESVAIVGPNGAGKTTFLKLLCGVLQASSGRLEWRGMDFRQLGRRDLARRVAYVPQVRPASVPLTIRQVVLLGRHPHFEALQLAPRPSDHRAVSRAIERAGLAGLENRNLDRLSGGERQAVFIAAALAQESELLVLDEPTTHLDPAHRLRVASLIERLRSSPRSDTEAPGHTLVLASHDLDLAAHVADRVIALKAGRVLATGTPKEVLSPELLTEVFEAPFKVSRAGTRARAMLDFEAGWGEP